MTDEYLDTLVMLHGYKYVMNMYCNYLIDMTIPQRNRLIKEHKHEWNFS